MFSRETCAIISNSIMTALFLYNRKVRTSLVKFLQNSLLHGKKVDPSWLTIMPLVHYLEGSLKPFAPLDLSTFEPSEAKKEKWWCFSEFKHEKDEMKYREWTM